MSKANPFWTAKHLSARKQTGTAFICLWRDITFEWSRINYNFCLKENKVFKGGDRNGSLVFEAISYSEILPFWLQKLETNCLNSKKVYKRRKGSPVFEGMSLTSWSPPPWPAIQIRLITKSTNAIHIRLFTKSTNAIHIRSSFDF